MTNLMNQEILKMSSPEFEALQHNVLYSIHGMSTIMGRLFKVFKVLEMLLLDNHVLFYLVMLAAAGNAVYFTTNLFMPIFLLQVCLISPTLNNLIKSLVSRTAAFLLVYCLIAIFMVIFAIYGFFFISESFYTKSDGGMVGENMCGSAFNCFMTMIMQVD